MKWTNVIRPRDAVAAQTSFGIFAPAPQSDSTASSTHSANYLAVFNSKRATGGVQLSQRVIAMTKDVINGLCCKTNIGLTHLRGKINGEARLSHAHCNNTIATLARTRAQNRIFIFLVDQKHQWRPFWTSSLSQNTQKHQCVDKSVTRPQDLQKLFLLKKKKAGSNTIQRRLIFRLARRDSPCSTY